MRALSALGLPLENLAFPAILQCPRCGQHTLQLFDDLGADGIWINCQGCSAHGDIIIFAAELWKLSLPNTLSKFSDLGLIPNETANSASAEYARYLRRKTAAENFLYDAESQVWNHGDDIIACRLRELGVRSETEQCQNIVGVAHHDQIATLCAALGRARPNKLRDDGPSIVFPFHDLPGRLTGFLLLQYNSVYEAKHNYVSLSGLKKRKPEAGYYLLKSAWTAKHPQFKNTQFVVDDALWALKAQCNALRNNHGWLPVLASYTGPEAESYGASWQAFTPTTRIFYSHGPTPELISRACNARGYVATQVTDRGGTYPRLTGMRKNAQTWQQALKTTLHDANEMNAEAFAKRLTIPPDKLNMFLDRVDKDFSPGFKDRIMMVANAPIDAPLTVQKKWFVTERENGWWNQIGRQLSNFRVRIEKVLHADNGEKIYAGAVMMDGVKYEFSELARRIERMGLLTYADSVLAQHGKLAIFDNAWDKKAHLIAMQLHSPELVSIATTYGWDETAHVFRFSGYEIDHTGAIKQTHPWPDRPKEKDFPVPAPIAPLPIHSLITPAHENSFVWAVAAALIANLLARIGRRDYVATALHADGFDLAIKIGEALGCDIKRTNAFQKHVAGNFLAKITQDIFWPAVCCSVFNDEVFGQCAPRFFNQPLLLRMSRPSAAVAVGYGWQRITGAATRPVDNVSPLRDLLPAYIQRILMQRGQIFNRSDSFTGTVLKDLHDWLLETYGSSFNLAHASDLIVNESRAHEVLMTEINNAIFGGKIAALPQPRNSRQSGDYILQKKEHWWLNQRAIDRYFYRARCVGPNWSAVVGLLQQEGVYAGEEVIHNMAGINVQADWCELFYSSPALSSKKEIG